MYSSGAAASSRKSFPAQLHHKNSYVGRRCSCLRHDMVIPPRSQPSVRCVQTPCAWCSETPPAAAHRPLHACARRWLPQLPPAAESALHSAAGTFRSWAPTHSRSETCPLPVVLICKYPGTSAECLAIRDPHNKHMSTMHATTVTHKARALWIDLQARRGATHWRMRQCASLSASSSLCACCSLFLHCWRASCVSACCAPTATGVPACAGSSAAAGLAPACTFRFPAAIFSAPCPCASFACAHSTPLIQTASDCAADVYMQHCYGFCYCHTRPTPQQTPAHLQCAAQISVVVCGGVIHVESCSTLANTPPGQ